MIARLQRRLAAGAFLALCTLAFPAVAKAQTAEDLLDKLKPWVRERFFGSSPAEEPPPSENPEMAAPAEPGAEAVTEVPLVDETIAPQTDGEPAAGEAAAAPETGAEPASDWPVGRVEPGQPAEGDATAATGSTETPAGSGVTEAPLAPPAPVDPGPPPLRFALLAGSSATVTMAIVGPIADEIGAAIGRPVELLAMHSYDAMIDAQAGLRIDGGFYSASAFALAEARCHCLEPIVAPRASDGTTAYHAIIVARADSGIASPADLEEKTIAVGPADSVGARRMQLAGLMASAIRPADLFGGVLETGSANEAVRLVRDRLADAAFAWSSMSGDVGSGYSRGTLHELVAGGELAMNDLVIVWRSPPITHGPFAAVSTLSEEEKDKLAAFFVGLDATRPEAYERLNPFYGGGYAPVDPADYRGLEMLTAQDVDALNLPKADVTIPVPRDAQPEEAD